MLPLLKFKSQEDPSKEIHHKTKPPHSKDSSLLSVCQNRISNIKKTGKQTDFPYETENSYKLKLFYLRHMFICDSRFLGRTFLTQFLYSRVLGKIPQSLLLQHRKLYGPNV